VGAPLIASEIGRRDAHGGTPYKLGHHRSTSPARRGSHSQGLPEGIQRGGREKLPRAAIEGARTWSRKLAPFGYAPHVDNLYASTLMGESSQKPQSPLFTTVHRWRQCVPSTRHSTLTCLTGSTIYKLQQRPYGNSGRAFRPIGFGIITPGRARDVEMCPGKPIRKLL